MGVVVVAVVSDFVVESALPKRLKVKMTFRIWQILR